MSMESVREDLARLERDVQALSHDAGRLWGDVRHQTRTLRDEALAAEYVATEETMENVGSVLDALARLRDIQRESWQDFFADHRETLSALTQVRSPVDLLRVGLEHWSRRATHLADGVNRTVYWPAKLVR
jgi:hypothetical protein